MAEAIELKKEKAPKKEKKTMTDEELEAFRGVLAVMFRDEMPADEIVTAQDLLEFVDSMTDEEDKSLVAQGRIDKNSYSELKTRAEKDEKVRLAEEARVETLRLEAMSKVSLPEIISRVKDESLNVDIKEEESLSEAKIPSGEEYLKYLEKNGSLEHVLAYRKVLDICKIIEEAGGKALLVGGSVRDMFMGKIPKDFDLEVYKIPELELKNLLTVAARELGGGIKTEVGKAFGITKLAFKTSKQSEEDEVKQVDLDISIPRTESKSGKGHKNFKVKLHPEMSIKEAARRRDFTMNSVSADPLTGKVYDGFNGLEDIKSRVLKVTDEFTFKDDPLRVLRAMQFIGRFALNMDKDSARIIQETAPDLKYIKKNRFGEEWTKLLTKSEQPSYGLIAGMLLGALDKSFPEFVELTKKTTESELGPEEDGWVHTLTALDAAAKIAKRESLDEDDKVILMYSVLCHGFRDLKTSDGSMTLTEVFLGKLDLNDKIKAKIKALVAEHRSPDLLYLEYVQTNKDGKKDTNGAVRRLATRLAVGADPATITMLVLVGEANHVGRVPIMSRVDDGQIADDKDVSNFIRRQMKDDTATDIDRVFKFAIPDRYEAGEWLVDLARKLKVEKSKPADLVDGKKLLAAGFKGGKAIGEIIQIANDLRDEMKDKYSSSDEIFAELVEWYEEPYPHPALVKDPNIARDKLKSILENHRIEMRG